MSNKGENIVIHDFSTEYEVFYILKTAAHLRFILGKTKYKLQLTNLNLQYIYNY